jgi:hypothetical protein
MSYLVSHHRRRTLRRGVRTRCLALRAQGLRQVGEQLLDLSPRGALIACDARVELGERLLLGFVPPGSGAWIDAEAEIARIIHGYRDGDRGYCAGVRFVSLDRASHGELLVRLAGVPPPVPQRRPTYDYAASVRRIAELG